MVSLAEIIYQHSLNLPEATAREALDFIEFLEQRYGIVTEKPASQQDTEAFIAAFASSLSNDFPDDITDDDLGSDVSRESLD